MNCSFIQVFIGIFIFLSIIVSTIYCIVYDSNDNEKVENREDSERNNAEIIWSWVSLMSCLVIIIILSILFIVDKKVKSLEILKTAKIYNFILLTMSLFSIVTTSVSWDYFSRKNTNQVQRESFMIITIIGIVIFLKELDSVFCDDVSKQIEPAMP